ncbi:MAG: SH3 domain-containing protein [Pseudoxanthomonas sp.]
MDFTFRPLRVLLTGLLLGGVVASAHVRAAEPPRAVAAPASTGVVGVTPAQLDPQFWIARQAQPDAVLLDAAGIAAQNARMRAEDPHIRDLQALSAQWSREEILKAIQALSSPPTRTLYDAQGQVITAQALETLQQAMALEAIPAQSSPQFGLVTARAALRTFPTTLRAFSRTGDLDIDRFQESALFPGDAVAVLHTSRDGRWRFVASERYDAWIEADKVALGPREQVLGYAQSPDFLIVTGATAHTTYTPEQPQVSQLQLDMGVRVPRLRDGPVDALVNGQHPYTGHVIQLPIRDAQGQLQLVPALLPRTADVADHYLPLTARHLIAQAFKFLGERYGWGHDYDARDCSGFVSEIYRSFGILVPRNTSAQAVSPALDRIAFDKPRAGKKPSDMPKRTAAVDALQVGDLVYIPGHVMVNIGHLDGLAYMIHDTAGGGWLGADGKRVAAHLNGVSVTPLEPMMASDTVSYVEQITNIQRIRPNGATAQE